MSPTSLRTWGLGLSAVVTVLLFFFGLPGVFSPNPKCFNFFASGTTKEKLDFRRRVSWVGSTVGVALILVGDLLQWLAIT